MSDDKIIYCLGGPCRTADVKGMKCVRCGGVVSMGPMHPYPFLIITRPK